MNVAETTLNYKMMDKFKELIEAKSGGKITLNLYANGQLGNDTEQMQAHDRGQQRFCHHDHQRPDLLCAGLRCVRPSQRVPGSGDHEKVLDDESFVDTLNRDSATTNVRMMGMADAGRPERLPT
ncbi:MAG: hypothetical protein ACLR0U_14185 [Enterocloster clostridioformis]